MTAVYQMELRPGCSLHSENTAERHYAAETGSLHLLSSTPQILPALWEGAASFSRKRMLEENIKGTKNMAITGQLVCSKLVHGMACLWHYFQKEKELRWEEN